MKTTLNKNGLVSVPGEIGLDIPEGTLTVGGLDLVQELKRLNEKLEEMTSASRQSAPATKVTAPTFLPAAEKPKMFDDLATEETAPEEDSQVVKSTKKQK